MTNIGKCARWGVRMAEYVGVERVWVVEVETVSRFESLSLFSVHSFLCMAFCVVLLVLWKSLKKKKNSLCVTDFVLFVFF